MDSPGSQQPPIRRLIILGDGKPRQELLDAAAAAGYDMSALLANYGG